MEFSKDFYIALGWMHAECCALLEQGEDPRKMDVAEMRERAERDCSNNDDTPDTPQDQEVVMDYFVKIYDSDGRLTGEIIECHSVEELMKFLGDQRSNDGAINNVVVFEAYVIADWS